MVQCSTVPSTRKTLTLRRRSGALRKAGAPTASMLAATLATEGDCTMPPKLMWPESPLCVDSLRAHKCVAQIWQRAGSARIQTS